MTYGLRSWGLGILLLAACAGRADDIALTNGTVISGDILQVASNSILILQADGKSRTVTRGAVKRYALDFRTGGRCARLTAADGQVRLLSLSAFDSDGVAGTDMAGKAVTLLPADIREAGVYPVTKPRHVLAVPYVSQKPDLCGEACIEMLSTFLGRPVPQDKVNELAGLDGTRGCHAEELVAAIRKLDVKVASESSWAGATDEDFLVDRMRLLACVRRNHPVLLGIWGNPRARQGGVTFDHIVLLIGYDLARESFIIHDPGRWPDWEVSFADFVTHRRNDSRTLCQIEFALFRTWKTAEGTEIPAELLDLDERTVRLKPVKGDAVTLDIDGLDPACAAFVRALSAGRAAPRPGQLLPQASLRALYMSARECAVRGEKAEAIALLTRAVDGGFTSLAALAKDKAFDSVREEAQVKAWFTNGERILADFVRNRVASVLDRMGTPYKAMSETNSPYIVIGDPASSSCAAVTDALRTVSDLHGKTLFTNKPVGAIIVVLPKTAEEYARMRGGGREALGSVGFYNHPARTLIVRKDSGSGTIAHEFTHALHFADMEARGQMHPVWVREGLGSLYEESNPKKDYLEGLPNWRLPVLRGALKAGKTFQLRALLEHSDRCFRENDSVAYAMSRYVFFFLQSKQILFPWYARYCEGYEKDPTGARALEKVYGKTVEEFEADWIEFVKTLR